MNPSLQKLKEIKRALNSKFLEREREVEGILLALLSKQHMLMIGPAGTAKSALSAELAKIVKGTDYFQWLLTPFSTPEEVFGPLSLKALEEGVYKRNTASKMPEAHIAFLDEIFKANSAILNSLLTLINERLFYNESSPVEVPLMSVIGASNEYPEEGEGLDALFDRFLLRYEIDFIEDEMNFTSMMKGEGQLEEMPSMHLDELKQLQELADHISIPEEVIEKLTLLRRELQDEGIQPSDRRFKQTLSVLKAKALVEQREAVQLADLCILENMLWETIDQKEIVCRLVTHHTQDSSSPTVASIEKEAEEIYDLSVRDRSTDAGMEAMQKLNDLLQELHRLRSNQPAQAEEIDNLTDKLSSLCKEVESSRTDYGYENEEEFKKLEGEGADGVYFRM